MDRWQTNSEFDQGIATELAVVQLSAGPFLFPQSLSDFTKKLG
jgi:hypothetical protein